MSTSSKAADAWVELTPNTASGDGRVQLQCTQAGTALYWMYNLKTKAAVPFTQPMSADCKDTNPVAVASASTNESDPFTHWVLVSSSQDESRQTFLFCSPEHTGFYWHYDTSVENPLGGSIWGTMIPASPDCMS